MDGEVSGWKTQKAGIRQGCTLSPYLFLITMTVIFHDVHNDPTLEHLLEQSRPPNLHQDEVLYADDTVLYSTDSATAEALLHKVEECSERYGLTLNKGKCETVNTNNNRQRIKFKNGNLVRKTSETKYLGCKISAKAETEKEVKRRKGECMAALKKNWKRFGNTVTAAAQPKYIYTTRSLKQNFYTDSTQPTSRNKCKKNWTHSS
jgi:hypothetical protein